MNILDSSKMEHKPLQISLYFSHDYVDSDLILKDKNVVVIDVLRTSTTMITGLSNGAKEIIPTDSIASAGMIGRKNKKFTQSKIALQTSDHPNTYIIR